MNRVHFIYARCMTVFPSAYPSSVTSRQRFKLALSYVHRDSQAIKYIRSLGNSWFGYIALLLSQSVCVGEPREIGRCGGPLERRHSTRIDPVV